MGLVKDFFSGAKEGAGQFASLLTDCVNLVLLFVVYFFGVGAVSVIAKLAGKRFLDLGGGGKSSHWTEAAETRAEDYFYRQF